MSRRGVLLAVLAVALVAGLVAGWNALFERVAEEVPVTRPGGHRHRALAEMFRRLDVEVHEAEGLTRLPPPGATLFLLAPRRVSGTDRLLAWVAAGGHLVVAPVGAPGEDPLLAAVRVVRFDRDQADDDDHLATSPFATRRPPWPLLYARAEEGVELLRYDGEADAAWILSVRHGAGVVTALSDAAFLRDDQIRHDDHALVAWVAAELEAPPPELWIVSRDRRPTIWAFVPRHAWLVGASLAVLIVAALLAAARRMGPRLVAAPRESRQLAEHVRAVGRYLWDVACEHALLAAARGALARERGVRELDAAAFVRLVAAPLPAGVAADDLRRAVALRDTRDRQRFTRAVRVLEKMRRRAR